MISLVDWEQGGTFSVQKGRQVFCRDGGPATAPALVLKLIDGASDPVSGRHMAARYSELMPSANVTLLEGIGHYPQVEAPEAVLEAYLQFRSG